MRQKIALIQINVANGDPKINFARVSKWAMEAAYSGVDVIVLPELWDTGVDSENLSVISDRDARATSEFLSDLAKQYQIAIIGGSIAEETESGIYNTMLIINKSGELVSKYSKQNLLDETDKNLHFNMGNQAFNFTLNGVASEAVIRDDFNYLRENAPSFNHTSLVYIVAGWNEQTINQHRNVLQTYAEKNSVYIIVCNRTGSDPKNEFAGKSCVMDPNGKMITESDNTENMIMTTIDLTAEDKANI